LSGGQPSERLVRAALLSARLFADSLDPNAMIRYAGLGLMRPAAAMDVLRRDLDHRPRAFGPPGDPRPQVPKETYARLELAVKEALESVEAEDDDDPHGLRAGLVGFGDSLRNQLGDDPAGLSVLLPADRRQVDRAVHPKYFKDWGTKVPPRPGPDTLIISEIKLLSDVRLVAMLCDPRRWSQGSLFWKETTGYDYESPAPPPLPDLTKPEVRREGHADSWKGCLHEVVAGLATFTVELDIDFQVQPDSCKLKYSFKSSPDRLTKDNGELTLTPLADDPGWLLAKVTKYIDFEDAPFGGPSSGDIMAPNFFASWMRIQQDIWATRIAELAALDAVET
jgi:hypothetical protein